MFKKLSVAATAATLALGAASAQAATMASGSGTTMPMSGSSMSGMTNLSDAQFVHAAAQSDLAEVAMGKLAMQKGSSQMVRLFGKRMVDDHSKANAQLKQVAAQQGIALPTTLSAKDQALEKQLAGLSGTAFDRAYLQAQEAAHMQTAQLFKAEMAKSTPVGTFAKNNYGAITHHLQLATIDLSHVNGGSAASSKHMGAMGSGAMGNGSMGNGSMSGGSMSNGSMSNGSMSNGSMSNGSMSGGTGAAGANPAAGNSAARNNGPTTTGTGAGVNGAPPPSTQDSGNGNSSGANSAAHNNGPTTTGTGAGVNGGAQPSTQDSGNGNSSGANSAAKNNGPTTTGTGGANSSTTGGGR